jgi:hypothetical protein
MATVLKKCITEKQRSVLRFSFVGKGTRCNEYLFIKKCFIFTVGSVCRVKRFTAEQRNSLKNVRKSQMMKRRCGNGLDNKKNLQCCGFRCTGKAMGEVYQCWWRICRETNFFLQVRVSHVLRFISNSDEKTNFIWAILQRIRTVILLKPAQYATWDQTWPNCVALCL